MSEFNKIDGIKYDNEKLRLFLKEQNEYYDVILNYSHKEAEIDISNAKYLDEEDTAYIRRHKNPKLQQEIALGRFSAKTAVSALIDKSVENINITKGVFNQPVVRVRNHGEDMNPQVSLSHCGNIAVSLAYPDKLIIGIDIEEQLGEAKADGMKLSENEKVLLTTNNVEKTYLWTIREALIKCLKVSVFFSSDVMEITELVCEERCIKGSFKNFSQYVFKAWKYNEFFVAIVYPRRTELLDN
ncbi:4'-phosphopantetheinyl transferase family protein [Butyrivibrio sp. YAB3001]|uniref:4'-phosphopantetheinyl transferase family protein n=1 Tax=Butyrivibrio sp. YAB3001 TaxID=1520812 RepID=UPI0008F63397|nr:4'-phosphopantetheinyl transferase superfamily protein [Butyrivibrio sp. YAB3001]SFC12481.1 4'-phosphopantetheinyl transferase superfamily protein [Butyrivibrio sp. YAB3001]